MNKHLNKSVTEDEITTSMFAIGADKASGPGGFTAAFYQHYWGIVGESVKAEVLKFFNHGELSELFNTLISA